MHARQLGRIMSTSVPRRLDVISEGLALLVEHVETLVADLEYLADGHRARSGAAIGIQAEEEAAKAFILLDLVRMGWKNQAACNEQIDRYYNHLARGIYAEAAHMRPADFEELKRLVDMYRRSRYLDGPNDVDWIFRNEIHSRREESLYVHYVAGEDGNRWVTPAQRDGYGSAWRVAAPRLVLAMARAGVTSRAGLDIIAQRWRGVVVEPTTHWSVIAEVNAQIRHDLISVGLAPYASSEDLHRIWDEWTFPMFGLAMDVIEVSDEELKSQRDAWLAAQY